MFKNRKLAISEGRSMIRVRWKKSKEVITAGACPGCWNDPERRQVLLKKMAGIGVEVVYKEDQAAGTYRKGKQHAPKCPYRTNRDRPH